MLVRTLFLTLLVPNFQVCCATKTFVTCLKELVLQENNRLDVAPCDRHIMDYLDFFLVSKRAARLMDHCLVWDSLFWSFSKAVIDGGYSLLQRLIFKSLKTVGRFTKVSWTARYFTEEENTRKKVSNKIKGNPWIHPWKWGHIFGDLIKCLVMAYETFKTTTYLRLFMTNKKIKYSYRRKTKHFDNCLSK